MPCLEFGDSRASWLAQLALRSSWSKSLWKFWSTSRRFVQKSVKQCVQISPMPLQGSGETGCAERGSFWAFEVLKSSKSWVWTLSLKIFSRIPCFIELQPCRHLMCRLSRREEQLGLSKQSIRLEVMVLFPVLTSRLVAAQRVAFLDSFLSCHLSLV